MDLEEEISQNMRGTGLKEGGKAVKADKNSG